MMSHIQTLGTHPILHRIACEYHEMPGLNLTAAQGARLWAMPHGEVLELLDRLVERGVLRRDPAGRYLRA
jgi:hypothetical protein